MFVKDFSCGLTAWWQKERGAVVESEEGRASTELDEKTLTKDPKGSHGRRHKDSTDRRITSSLRCRRITPSPSPRDA